MKTKKPLAKRLLKGFLISGIILGLLCIFSVAFAFLGKQATLEASLQGKNAQALADGQYTGHYSAFRFSNTVTVQVVNGQITDIAVVTPQVAAKPVIMDTLRTEIIHQQTTAVDTVAGATADSKAYLKAIENALDPQTP